MNYSPYILIIDDNPLAIKLFANYLSDLEYNCISAKNGKEALEILSNYAFSLIICDLNMPIMDGFDFITAFRSKHEYDFIPILVVSSDDKEENVIKILNSGADDFVSKPIHENVFVSKIKAMIQKSQFKKHDINRAAFQLNDFTNSRIMYCTSENSEFSDSLIENSGLSFSIIKNSKDLFEYLYVNTVNLICIDESATWLFDVFQRFVLNVKQSIPIVYMVSESYNFPIDIGNAGIFYKSFSKDYIISQFQFLLSIQAKNKNEYLNSLKKALVSSSFLFERFKEIEFKLFKISILHENYDDVPGGDYYEIFDIQDRYKVIFMGDIMGKSWNAWMYVPIYLAYIRTTIKFLASRNILNVFFKPEKILYLLNQYCAKDLQLSEIFSTLSIIVIDSVKEKVIVTSAAGISPLYYNAHTKTIEEISLSGNLLGINSTSQYISKEISFGVNDVIIVYSDGFLEAMQVTTNEIVGKVKMKEVFTSFINKNLQSSLDFETVFLNECSIQKFNDDRSLLVLSRK